MLPEQKPLWGLKSELDIEIRKLRKMKNKMKKETIESDLFEVQDDS